LGGLVAEFAKSQSAKAIQEGAAAFADPKKRAALEEKFAKATREGDILPVQNPFWVIGFTQASARSALGNYQRTAEKAMDEAAIVRGADETGQPAPDFQEVLDEVYEQTVADHWTTQDFYGRQQIAKLKDDIDSELLQAGSRAYNQRAVEHDKNVARSEMAGMLGELSDPELTHDETKVQEYLEDLSTFVTERVHRKGYTDTATLVGESLASAVRSVSTTNGPEAALHLLDQVRANLVVGTTPIEKDAKLSVVLNRLQEEQENREERERDSTRENRRAAEADSRRNALSLALERLTVVQAEGGSIAGASSALVAEILRGEHDEMLGEDVEQRASLRGVAAAIVREEAAAIQGVVVEDDLLVERIRNLFTGGTEQLNTARDLLLSSPRGSISSRTKAELLDEISRRQDLQGQVPSQDSVARSLTPVMDNLSEQGQFAISEQIETASRDLVNTAVDLMNQPDFPRDGASLEEKQAAVSREVERLRQEKRSELAEFTKVQQDAYLKLQSTVAEGVRGLDPDAARQSLAESSVLLSPEERDKLEQTIVQKTDPNQYLTEPVKSRTRGIIIDILAATDADLQPADLFSKSNEIMAEVLALPGQSLDQLRSTQVESERFQIMEAKVNTFLTERLGDLRPELQSFVDKNTRENSAFNFFQTRSASRAPTGQQILLEAQNSAYFQQAVKRTPDIKEFFRGSGFFSNGPLYSQAKHIANSISAGGTLPKADYDRMRKRIAAAERQLFFGGGLGKAGFRPITDPQELKDRYLALRALSGIPVKVFVNEGKVPGRAEGPKEQQLEIQIEPGDINPYTTPMFTSLSELQAWGEKQQAGAEGNDIEKLSEFFGFTTQAEIDRFYRNQETLVRQVYGSD
jgi:hypothetical protein